MRVVQFDAGWSPTRDDGERELETLRTENKKLTDEVESLQAYTGRLGRSMVRWNGATVQSIDCAERRCDVTLQVDITVIGALQGARRMNTTAPANETWLLIDKQLRGPGGKTLEFQWSNGRCVRRLFIVNWQRLA